MQVDEKGLEAALNARPIFPGQQQGSTVAQVMGPRAGTPNPKAYMEAAIAAYLAAIPADGAGVRVKPLDTSPTGEDALEPDEVNVQEGAWAIVIGTNGKPAGWIDTHALFAHQIYRDQILPLPKSPEPGQVGGLRMTPFSEAAPVRDELNGEQTILTYCEPVGTWGLEFFESGWDFPERWLGATHWLDITGMWPGVIAQTTAAPQPPTGAGGDPVAVKCTCNMPPNFHADDCPARVRPAPPSDELREAVKIAHDVHLHYAAERDRIQTTNTVARERMQARTETAAEIWKKINALLPREPNATLSNREGA